MVYCDGVEVDSKLGRLIQAFRCDRPSEWQMDEFIQMAEDMHKEITRLREAERDAARYRWLRDRVCMFYVSAEDCDSKDAYLTVTGYGDDDSREVVDAAIDDQMKEKGDE